MSVQSTPPLFLDQYLFRQVARTPSKEEVVKALGLHRLWHASSLKRGLFEWGEGEQFVAVVFVLLASCGDLGGQAALQVVGQSVEAVQDGNNFFLHWEWRNRDQELLYNRTR